MDLLIFFAFIVLPVVLGGGCICLIWKDYFQSFFNKHKIRKENLIKDQIAENSFLVKQVLEINKETKYYTDILDDGKSLATVNVDSKAKFDRINPKDGGCEFVERHRTEIERALEQVARNKVIKEVYEKKLSRLSSTAVKADADKMRIRFEHYLRLEQEVAFSRKLNIVDNYKVVCLLRYCSPKGRKDYSKYTSLDEEDIRLVFREQDRRTAYQSSETYRRKYERAKVTPSLRYNVLQRDGFRCCLCGRTAADGVELEVDHVVPISKGGSTTYSNLQTLCKDCNRGKGAKV